uniref:hypothetical protein n=1 Tax=Salmonella enterica TaxID=28901 RepID=UPI0020C4D426
DVRAIFEQMELELIASMKRNLSRHQKWEKDEGINWTMWQVEQLKTLEEFNRGTGNYRNGPVHKRHRAHSQSFWWEKPLASEGRNCT